MGVHLGPNLRAERGERAKVRVRNLDEASGVHWHGKHLPPPRWTADRTGWSTRAFR